MPSSSLRSFILLTLAAAVSRSQSTDSGYLGYTLNQTGSVEDATYETANTNTNVSTTWPEPDVFLNASVHVGEIDIEVDNLTAKINLEAQVLQLLDFNAGVDLSIDRVSLTIQNVSAEVTLEARLENVVTMISDVLDSIDLNPIIATLGEDVTEIVNSTVSALDDTTSSVDKRSYDLTHNVLYSINDYSGNTHTNRILAQDGSIVDQYLHNDGDVYKTKIVGSYLTDMTFNGYNRTTVKNGQTVREQEYVYTPYYGLSIVSAVYTDDGGSVVGTQVLSESGAGGSSTIGDL
ncbi:hypothetical protein UCRPC4_g01916 [Phaeomoniella chlamydospora]|uniref:Cell wall protein n=1 Tax=Phaeomoniella chlamydospora TaxID=158046 RepID=A0A0G2ER64_PHACM|nr:hypothetical protein UCRPC4_g01916 [Phaeomoniella chlamydospora]